MLERFAGAFARGEGGSGGWPVLRVQRVGTQRSHRHLGVSPYGSDGPLLGSSLRVVSVADGSAAMGHAQRREHSGAKEALPYTTSA